MSNQASEDEQRTFDDILSQAFTDGASDTMWQNNKHVEIFATAKKELEALIRTEKLKLLAEVRERVIGEDEVFVDLPIVDGTGKTISIVDRSFTTYMVVKNQLRAEQRTKLTKLEAEL